jgi:hypothetical protein
MKFKTPKKVESGFFPRKRVMTTHGCSDEQKDFNSPISEQFSTGVSGASHTSEWLEPVLSQLESLSSLEKNWDGYGAAAPRPEVVLAAIKFIRHLAANSVISAPHVSPTRTGGVLFEWERDPYHLEVQFVSKDAASFAYLDSNTNQSVTGALFTDDQDATFYALLNRDFVVE